MRRLEDGLQRLVKHATGLSAVLEVLVVVILGELGVAARGAGEEGQRDASEACREVKPT